MHAASPPENTLNIITCSSDELDSWVENISRITTDNNAMSDRDFDEVLIRLQKGYAVQGDTIKKIVKLGFHRDRRNNPPAYPENTGDLDQPHRFIKSIQFIEKILPYFKNDHYTTAEIQSLKAGALVTVDQIDAVSVALEETRISLKKIRVREAILYLDNLCCLGDIYIMKRQNDKADEAYLEAMCYPYYLLPLRECPIEDARQVERLNIRAIERLVPLRSNNKKLLLDLLGRLIPARKPEFEARIRAAILEVEKRDIGEEP
jgi:hypothetical protein